MAEQGLQARGGQPFAALAQQGQQAGGQAPLVLLAAVRQPPGQGNAGGGRVPKDRRYQGGELLHLGRHHQDVPGGEAGIGGEQLQQPIPQDLHLAQPARAGVKFQGAIARGALQGPPLVRIHQSLLQLLQQARWSRLLAGGARLGDGGGGGKQVLLQGFAQLGLAAALQQLLEFGAEPAKTGLQAGHAQAPGVAKGIEVPRLAPRRPQRRGIPVFGTAAKGQAVPIQAALIRVE